MHLQRAEVEVICSTPAAFTAALASRIESGETNRACPWVPVGMQISRFISVPTRYIPSGVIIVSLLMQISGFIIDDLSLPIHPTRCHSHLCSQYSLYRPPFIAIRITYPTKDPICRSVDPHRSIFSIPSDQQVRKRFFSLPENAKEGTSAS